MKVGDIVKLSFHAWRNDRTALVIERCDDRMYHIMWHYSGEIEKANSDYFEVVSESR